METPPVLPSPRPSSALGDEPRRREVTGEQRLGEAFRFLGFSTPVL